MNYSENTQQILQSSIVVGKDKLQNLGIGIILYIVLVLTAEAIWVLFFIIASVHSINTNEIMLSCLMLRQFWVQISTVKTDLCALYKAQNLVTSGTLLVYG